MSSKLVTAIKRAANSLHNDVVENFTAIVIEPTDGSDHITRAKEQGMISVKQVTGKIITTYVEPDKEYYNSVAVQQDTLEKLNKQSGEPIWPNVELQPVAGSFNFSIPAVGSYVRVFHSKYQIPFVIQMSEVVYSHSSMNNADVHSGVTTTGTYSKINTDNNFYVLDNTGHNLAVIDNLNVEQSNAKLMADQYQVQVGSTTQTIQKQTDGKFTHKNSTTSLKEIISGLNTQLNNTVTAATSLNAATATAFAAGSFPAAASSFAAATGAIATQLSTISSQLSALDIKINSLLDS